jgi:hypothetical protein
MSNRKQQFQDVLSRIDSETSDAASTVRDLVQQLKDARAASGTGTVPAPSETDTLSEADEDEILGRLTAVADQLDQIGKLPVGDATTPVDASTPVEDTTTTDEVGNVPDVSESGI